MDSYDRTYRRSLQDPDGFWGEAARALDWSRPPDATRDDPAAPRPRWFPGGELNTCYNAVDRHVAAGRGAQPALIYDSPVTRVVRTLTYAELRQEVARLAGALAGLGVARGDRVLLYMPMVPEAVIGMLACARLGAIHSVVFGGFAAGELAVRIDHAEPTVILSASCGIEPGRIVDYKHLLDGALERSGHRVAHRVILQRPEHPATLGPHDHDWAELVAGATPAPCVPVAATDPLYVLYTSGTTGQPKGVVRDNGGHAVALHWTMGNVYGAGPGDVYWTASDVGWVVGHSYIVYGPLLAGCTTVLYEGKPVGTPDAGAFWRVIAQHRVRALFTAPTALRAIKREDPKGRHLAAHDVSSLRHLFLAGERLDPDTYHWASDLLGIPVIDHWWQTETGWPIAANCVGLGQLPVRPGSPTKPVPGYDVQVLDAAGNAVPPGTDGTIAVRLPLPPGTAPTLWRDDDRFVSSYLSTYPGHYLTGDGGHVDADGYVWVMGRIDDVINVAGHRLSTGALEEALATHPDVAETAVIGVHDDLKGQVPLGLAVLKADTDRDPAELEAELVALVREQVGAVASFRRAVVVARLPKTRSGKILRGTLRSIAEGRPYQIPSTIDDATVLEELTPLLR